MVKKALVSEKIDRIVFCLNRIKRFQNMSFEEFKKDQDAQDIVVHNLFLAIQNLIDIGNHIIADDVFETPGYYGEIPQILSKEKVISESLALIFKKMISFRNIIVHEYSKIDLAKVYDILINGIDDINRIIDEIIKYANL
ncbi:type VII toxin-antitoxin system HepT family RNase toxin [Caldicellulosiruptor morganii]|uniref:DUF86 domain-containing protein n=1 Tax=Caldicellulosiruptor morganii TaxID=1387555 RepID=A0ABY7BLY2_9FIRM|nr:DUF86 domain-containing protein [Caldicellulosiruptor morganii]WAM33056.1 DUF86 domain-containing protein [Caldicellulosiruptor morganii]